MFRSLHRSLLSIGMAGVLAAMLVLGIALWSFQELDRNAREAMVAKDVVADILPPPMYLVEMRLVLSQAVERTLTSDAAGKEVERLAQEYLARVSHWTENPPFGLEKQLLGAQHEEGLRFIAASRRVIATLAEHDEEGTLQALRTAQAIYANHRARVNDTVEAGNRFAETAIRGFDTAQASGVQAMCVLTAGLLAVMVACYYRARRSILDPLRECTALALNVAAGDLTDGMAGAPRNDEIGQLQSALADMTQRLSAIVLDARHAVDTIAQTSIDISRGNNDLSHRTERQASSLQETSTAMEQLTGAVKSSATATQQVHELSNSVAAAASAGGLLMSEVIATIEEVSSSSKRIADIIGVIDGFASQTNILALNAAVEAARAGENGRGFAVVAGEVRALARRSAAAAHEIKALIDASVRQVEKSSDLVSHAGQTIRDVACQVQHVRDLISRISSASSEQTSGIETVGCAVCELDKVAQQNATLVQRNAGAAECLINEANHLARVFGVFKTTAATEQAARLNPAAAPISIGGSLGI